jgi:hypothetical protein
MLEHRLFRSRKSGKVINTEWVRIHWPHYWHFDFFQGLRAVQLVGRLGDPRAGEALDLLRSQRGQDGTWKASGWRYWSLGRKSNVDVVDWGDAHEIVTAAALVVLQ